MTPFSGVALLAWLAVAPAGLQVPAYRPPASGSTSYLLLLRKGPAWSAARTPDVDKLEQAHVLHLSMMAADGHLLVTGPIPDEGDLCGIALLAAPSLEAARALEATDPAVTAGRLGAEILPISIPANWFAFAPIAGDQAVRRFVAVLLLAGPNRIDEAGALADNAEWASLWAQRAADGLVLAGSIAGGGVRRGLLVYAVDDIARATALAESGPSVQTGRLVVEAHAWLAPDGILTIVK